MAEQLITETADVAKEAIGSLPAYRTTFTLLGFGLMVLAVLVLCTPEGRPAVAPVVVGGLVTLGVASAGKSAWQHHVNARADAAKVDPP
jgi:uncharacterized membrane protein HdeD (DUF308 family)